MPDLSALRDSMGGLGGDEGEDDDAMPDLEDEDEGAADEGKGKQAGKIEEIS